MSYRLPLMRAAKVLERLAGADTSSSPLSPATEDREKSTTASNNCNSIDGDRDVGEEVFLELSDQLDRAEDGLLAGARKSTNTLMNLFEGVSVPRQNMLPILLYFTYFTCRKVNVSLHFFVLVTAINSTILNFLYKYPPSIICVGNG